MITQNGGSTEREARAHVFETDATVERHLGKPPISVRQLLLRFILGGILALVLVSTVTAFASRRVGTQRAIAEARTITFISAVGVIETNADDAILNDPHTSSDYRIALDQLNTVVTGSVLRGSLVRVKLWASDGTIVYSDEPRLIGQKFTLGDEELAVFAGGGAHAEVSDVSKPENQFESERKLLSVYQLTKTKQGTPVVFEAYFQYSGVRAAGLDLWKQFAPIAIGALIALEVIQIPIALTLARRLRTGQIQREKLLRHAIQASEAERRRIASDLHDGVVQDFTGLSMSLAATSWASGPDAAKMAAASEVLRDGIKSLRSLLVEIYPPNLHEEGLESALGDLVSGLSNRGISARLLFDLEDETLSDEAVELLYRTAQEALRNVVSHSGAQHVRVVVSVDNGLASVIIDDDGKGFTPDRMTARSDAGHVGIRALADLISASGGSLSVSSSTGEGTRVEARLPVDDYFRKGGRS